MTEEQTPTRSKGSCLRRVLIAIGAVVFLSLCAVSFVMMAGRVVGEEFSPNTFNRRRFEYTEIPWIGTQILPIKRSIYADDLSRYLATHNLIPVSPSAPTRWDLIWDNRTSAQSPDCDAAIICTYLDAATEDGQLYWLNWTQDRPERAKLLWPIIAELARQGDYLVIPDAFEAAASDLVLDELKVTLESLAVDRFALLYHRAIAAGEQERADQLAQSIRRWDPEHAVLGDTNETTDLENSGD